MSRHDPHEQRVLNGLLQANAARGAVSAYSYIQVVKTDSPGHYLWGKRARFLKFDDGHQERV